MHSEPEKPNALRLNCTAAIRNHHTWFPQVKHYAPLGCLKWGNYTFRGAFSGGLPPRPPWVPQGGPLLVLRFSPPTLVRWPPLLLALLLPGAARCTPWVPRGVCLSFRLDCLLCLLQLTKRLPRTLLSFVAWLCAALLHALWPCCCCCPRLPWPPWPPWLPCASWRGCGASASTFSLVSCRRQAAREGSGSANRSLNVRLCHSTRI